MQEITIAFMVINLIDQIVTITGKIPKLLKTNPVQQNQVINQMPVRTLIRVPAIQGAHKANHPMEVLVLILRGIRILDLRPHHVVHLGQEVLLHPHMVLEVEAHHVAHQEAALLMAQEVGQRVIGRQQML